MSKIDSHIEKRIKEIQARSRLYEQGKLGRVKPKRPKTTKPPKKVEWRGILSKYTPVKNEYVITRRGTHEPIAKTTSWFTVLLQPSAAQNILQ